VLEAETETAGEVNMNTGGAADEVAAEAEADAEGEALALVLALVLALKLAEVRAGEEGESWSWWFAMMAAVISEAAPVLGRLGGWLPRDRDRAKGS
jgi:hypothetical protein